MNTKKEKQIESFNLPKIKDASFKIKISSNKNNEITIVSNNLNDSILDNII